MVCDWRGIREYATDMASSSGGGRLADRNNMSQTHGLQE